MKRVLVTVLAIITIACSDQMPTSPSPATSVGPRQTLLPDMVAPLAGTVVSASGAPVVGATVRVLDGLSAGTTVTTDANGQYRFERLPRTNANFSVTAVNYIENRRGVSVDGSNTLDFTLDPTPLFVRSGTGSETFDLPGTVTRVRVNGQWSGSGSSTFTVRIAGRTVINQTIRTPYEAVHSAAANGGGTVEIVNAANTTWTVTEVR